MDLQQQRLIQIEINKMESKKKKISIGIITSLIGFIVILPLSCINKFYLGQHKKAWRRLVIQTLCLSSLVILEWGGTPIYILVIGSVLFYLVPFYDLVYSCKFIKKHNNEIDNKIMDFLKNK